MEAWKFFAASFMDEKGAKKLDNCELLTVVDSVAPTDRESGVRCGNQCPNIQAD